MSDPTKVDANDLLVKWNGEGLTKEDQHARARSLLVLAKPLMTMVAEQTAALPEDDRADGLKRIVGMLKTLKEDDRGFWIGRTAKIMKVSKTIIQEGLKPKNGKAKKDDDDREPIYTTGGWFNHHLVEMFYKEDEMKTYLVVRYPDGTISDLQERVYVGDLKLMPITVNSTITKKTVRYPSDLGEMKSEDELLDLTRKHILRYFDFGGNDFFEELSPMYVPFSYLYDGFMEVSYLRALGDYGTGKTRFLKSMGMLCYRPIYMSGGSSAASIYSLLDVHRGTLVLNEGDFTQSDEASMIAKILNGGTERGESVTKMRGSMDNMTVESFNVFGPKVIATRKEFNDHAIRSRCLTMEMLPMSPNPRIPQSLPPEKEMEDLLLRNMWTTFRLKNAQENVRVDESKIDRSLEPRLNQITLSILQTIKDEAMKEKIQSFLREYGKRARDDRYETFTARVLEGLVLAWAWGPVSERDEDTFRVYMKDIATAINLIVDHQKAQLGEEDDEDEKPGQDKKPEAKKTKSRKVSGVFTNFLQIKTIRATDGDKEYKGTKYVNMAEELDRVKALCVRWGVEWLERGVISEEADKKGLLGEDEKWMLKPRVVMLNLNEPAETIKKAEKQWKNRKFTPHSEDE